MSNQYRRIVSFSKGKLKGNQLKQFEVLGMNNKEMCDRVIAQFEKPGMGEKIEGAYLPNLHLWEDVEAAQWFERGTKQELSSTIFTGKTIGSYPLELEHNGIANSFLMYMGWGFEAFSNYAAPLFQRVDYNKIVGIAAVIAAASLQDPIRKLSKGLELEEEDLDPVNMAVKGVFNSGMFGPISTIIEKTNAAFDIFPEFKTSKTADKGKLELLSAAPYSFFNMIGTAAGMGLNGEYNKKDLKTIKRNLPLINALEFQKLGNDFIDSLDIPETRGAAHKERLREKGEVPEKKHRPKKKGRD
jgi:hypothetical protein